MGLRHLRVNEAVKEALSAVITAEELKDPRVGFVTVTGVETTPDLCHAKVYVSVLGSDAERAATLAALERSRGYLQSRLGASLRLKRTPQLQFVYDATLDNAMHISVLMAQEEEVLGREPHEILVGGEEPEAEGAEAGADEDAEDDADEGTERRAGGRGEEPDEGSAG